MIKHKILQLLPIFVILGAFNFIVCIAEQNRITGQKWKHTLLREKRISYEFFLLNSRSLQFPIVLNQRLYIRDFLIFSLVTQMSCKKSSLSDFGRYILLTDSTVHPGSSIGYFIYPILIIDKYQKQQKCFIWLHSFFLPKPPRGFTSLSDNK